MLDERATVSDPLSYSLSSIPWSASRSGAISRCGAWGARVPTGQASFYAVRRGKAWLSVDGCGTTPVPLRTGDVVLLPRGTGHSLNGSPDPDGAAEDWESFERSRITGDDASVSDVTTLVFGHSAGYGSTETPLHTHLSSIIHMNVEQYPELHRLDHSLDLILSDQRERSPGWQVIANRLVDVMFYQALRTFVTFHRSQSPEQGASAGTLVTDPAIGLVVGLLHSQPGDTWTVASLARWVNMSRSAFSERFREVVGQPPLQYLTQLRMARAGQMLTTTDLDVKRIAAIVGYESPSSFTNAFKRWNGTSPMDFRTREPSANRVRHDHEKPVIETIVANGNGQNGNGQKRATASVVSNVPFG